MLLWKAVWSFSGLLHLGLVASVGKRDTPTRLKLVEVARCSFTAVCVQAMKKADSTRWL